MTLEWWLIPEGDVIPRAPKPPIPPRIIGRTRRAIIHKKHIYFHCRNALKEVDNMFK